MAFQTGTSSSIENLLTQLSTFAQANGWTEDHYISGNLGVLGLSKNNVFVQFSWDETGGSNAGRLCMWQSTSNDDSAQPWRSTGNDGGSARNISGGNFWGSNLRGFTNAPGPHTAYWFFEQDASPAYIHVVLEVDTGIFRHFGFGELEKIGNWAGGEYSYGSYWEEPPGFDADDPTDFAHAMLFDSKNNSASTADNRGASLRAPGLSEMIGVGAEWLLCGFASQFPVPSQFDFAGNPKGACVGGGRGGTPQCFTGIRASPLSAFVPLIPMPVYFTNLISTSGIPNNIKLLGTHPDVRRINIANFEPGQILTVAGDDWYIFPWIRKRKQEDNQYESWHGGYAYKRVNA